ncbi:MAG: DUF423 domain-containing protein [bacterium]
MSTKIKLIIAGISGLFAVALGAFGAHSLKSMVDETMLETFKTGVNYHLIHSIVLLVLAFAKRSEFNKSFIFILTGILLFSFSLYLYSISQITIFAYVTPFGGISFLIGWGMIIYAARKIKFEHDLIEQKKVDHS